MKRNRRVSKFLKEEDTDPLSVVVNLFDVAMVFAVALMVAMVMHEYDGSFRTGRFHHREESW